jgi:hypothetical protein
VVFSLKKRSSILTIQLLLEFGFDHPISKLRLGLDVFKVGIWNWYWLPSIPAVWKFLKLELETYINTERHWAYCPQPSRNAELFPSVFIAIDFALL